MESHNDPPQGATPTKVKRAATEAGAGKAAPVGQIDAGSTTKTDAPKPRAIAAEPQEPEP